MHPADALVAIVTISPDQPHVADVSVRPLPRISLAAREHIAFLFKTKGPRLVGRIVTRALVSEAEAVYNQLLKDAVRADELVWDDALDTWDLGKQFKPHL